METDHVEKYEDIGPSLEHIVHGLSDWNNARGVVPDELRPESAFYELFEESKAHFWGNFIPRELNFSQVKDGLVVPENMVTFIQPENEYNLTAV
jgi:hypothetical protein